MQTTGVFGGKTYIQTVPRKLVKSKNFVQIACGKEFSLGITKMGELYGWGNGYLAKKKCLQPDLIPFDKKIVSVSAGKLHCAAIDADGLTYTWGSNGDWFSGNFNYCSYRRSYSDQSSW